MPRSERPRVAMNSKTNCVYVSQGSTIDCVAEAPRVPPAGARTNGACRMVITTAAEGLSFELGKHGGYGYANLDGVSGDPSQTSQRWSA
jgi:hypothetical protein